MAGEGAAVNCGLAVENIQVRHPAFRFYDPA